MLVSDILKAKSNPVLSIGPEKTIKDAMDLIMKNKIGALPVLDNDSLVGIITERDVFRAFYGGGEAILRKKINEIMTTDLIVGLPDDDIESVEAFMTNNRFRHLPIMENQKLIGIVSIGDVVKNMTKNLKVENRYLKDYITGKYPG